MAVITDTNIFFFKLLLPFQVRIMRQGHPYGDCVDGRQFFEDYGRKYSITVAFNNNTVK